MCVLIQVECLDVIYFECIIPGYGAVFIYSKHHRVGIAEAIECNVALVGIKWSDKTL